ncbi:tRNA-specific adenosine deaminase [Candidatus Kaiserbacteria bacterium]|nr:MAG: tRNA-specific adenosine deaminase [Candidatus Kaiserbacteria bacterium]
MEANHQEYLNEAIDISVQSIKDGGGPFGAVIVKDGEIIARGSNGVTKDTDSTAHAEIVAIREACKALNSFQLTGCTLYSSTEPCPMCLGAVYWARFDSVYFSSTKEDAANYGFDDSFIYEEISKEGGSRSIPFIKLEVENSLRAYTDWEEKEDKIHY